MVTIGLDCGRLGGGEIAYAVANAVARARLALDVVRRRLGPGLRMRGDIIGLASVFNDDAGTWLDAQTTEPDDVRLRIAVASDDRAEADRAHEEVLALYTCGYWKSVVLGKCVSVSVGPGGRRIIKKKK